MNLNTAAGPSLAHEKPLPRPSAGPGPLVAGVARLRQGIIGSARMESFLQRFFSRLRESQADVDSKRQADSLYAFQMAVLKCVPLSRERGGGGAAAIARICTRSGGGIRNCASPARAPLSRALHRPPTLARKRFTKQWAPRSTAAPGPKYPSTVIDNWSAAWKVRRHWEDVTLQRASQGKVTY